LGLLLAAAAGAQPPQPKPAAPRPPASTLTPAQLAAPAAVVNGQVIPEAAVQRGLKRVPPSEHARARPEILDYLIDNMLIDQYLVQKKVAVDPKAVAARMGEVQAEVKKHGQEYAKMLADLMITENELKAQMTADLRWEKFVADQATEPVLKALYDQNVEIFDGSQVHARHILLTPTATDPITTAAVMGSVAVGVRRMCRA
jgi:peptidyl-prolyl cis-trans isomerase C